jgi:dTDP-glucose pyrophosphorylase
MKSEAFIRPAQSLKSALKSLDRSGLQVLLVVDDQSRLLGTLSDGDIRRAILAGNDIERSVEGLFNTSPSFFQESEYSEEEARRHFLEKRISLIPILDGDKRVVRYVVWDELFGGREQRDGPRERMSLPVVIMAGGKGSRLAPITNVIPKPLIPIGERTVLELVIDEFVLYGMDDFRFTLNYRGEMIRSYFDSLEKPYRVSYVWEKEFLGTAGSLRLVRDQIGDTFIVSNCDIIVRAKYPDVEAFHRRSEAWLTIISSIQHYRIPYGVVEFRSRGEVTGIREKPEYSFPVNTGVYIFDRRSLDYITEGKPMNMDELIRALIAADKPVFTYPVNESQYIDVGQWEEYKKAIERISIVT